MSKAYELADGSLSTDYEVGDEFVVTRREIDGGSTAPFNALLKLTIDDGTKNPFFRSSDGEECCGWGCLIPSTKTKRKAQARKGKSKFTINRGDYIDSRQFTREECERFCELAVECGHGRGEWTDGLKYADGDLIVARPDEGIMWFIASSGKNITTQFREFLDKEKGVKQFTKDDLKDGMRVEFANGAKLYWFKGDLYEYCIPLKFKYSDAFLDDELKNTSASSASSLGDAAKVTDRDGTVLFEREPEKVTLNLEVTPEQADSIKKQLGL